jgi:hypothetical protein
MIRQLIEAERQSKLRLKAISQLTGQRAPTAAGTSGSAALEVLYRLASSPETAPEALALPHELQVHQVELEIQGEELSRACAECEAALFRQMQLYDFAPVGSFTVDGNTILFELNLTGAHLLGSERDALLGRRLDSFLTLGGGRALRELLSQVGEGRLPNCCMLELIVGEGAPASVCVSVEADPAGGHFLLAFIKTGERSERPMNEPDDLSD